MDRGRRAGARWAVAVVGPLLAGALPLAAPRGAELPPFALLLSAVVASAWYGGTGPGLVAAAIGGGCALVVAAPTWLALLAYLGEGALVSVLVGSLHEAVARARAAAGAAAVPDAAPPSARARGAAEFLGVLSHELRTPLGTLRNALRALALGLRSDEALELSGRQVDRLTELVDGLLDVSRIERGTLALDPEVVDLGAEIEAVAEEARPALAGHSKTLHAVPPPEPLRLSADRTRLRQVLLSLIDNATRHTSEGGNVFLEGRRDGRDAVIVVRDDGEGMAEEVVAEVFDPFRPGTGEPHRRRGGLGIGLGIARAVAQLHGGGVAVRSEGPGRGTEVVVRLPALPPAVDSTVGPG